MTTLPTTRTIANTASEHVSDHNELHDGHNLSETHRAATTSVHGITNTANLETTTGAQTKVDAHVNDSSAAHAASAISFSPTGTIAGTDVQAAIAEVASEAALDYGTTTELTDLDSGAESAGVSTKVARADHKHAIANDTVTYAKIQDVAAASRLIGRGSAAGAGDPQEISLGTGLSMSGTTLSASGTAPTIVRKLADEIVNNSSTLQNDDELFFSIATSEVWVFEFVIRVVSATASPDIKLNVAADNAVTALRWGVVNEWDTTDAFAPPKATGHVAPIQIGIGIGTHRLVVIKGIVVNAGAGANVVRLQWAQQAATAEDTSITIHSYLIAHKTT